MRSGVLLLSIVLLAALLAAPAAAQDVEGLIAFENRYDDDNGLDRIEVMAADGSDRRVIVDDGFAPALSPDGSRVAFVRDGDVHVADVDSGQESVVAAGPTSESNPAWSPDGTLLAFTRGMPAGPGCSHLFNTEVFITDFSDEVQVTDSPCLAEGHPDFAPDGGRIAYHTFYLNPDFSGSVSIVWTQDLRTGDVRQVTDPSEDGRALSPAWSPDGDRIAWEGLYEVHTTPATGGSATQVTQTPDDCGASSQPAWSPDGDRLAVTLLCGEDTDLVVVPAAGGTGIPLTGPEGQESNASWVTVGEVSPGPGPTPTPPPSGAGSTPPAPDEPVIELVDGGRVDGGGATDPVGQALATSESIWADGGAPLVVLATAANFPDALAGSALAGEQGPVLVTPFGPDLDPRVRDEIARVTGGDGMVLILGGVSAVTETAASQARAAAGASSCAAPFPTDCRYAGTGREHTAALVGQTVLALNGGSGSRALLARGDAFADAITGGAYAAEAGVPILLTPSTSLNTITEQFITDNGIGQVIILGGTAAVSDDTAAAVPTTTRRIAGDDRTATAAAIATQLWRAEDLAGGGIVLVNVRDDDGWQAALAAAVLSALANAPQLGVENPPAGPTPATLDAAATLGGPVETHGSTALVSDDQLDTVRQAAS